MDYTLNNQKLKFDFLKGPFMEGSWYSEFLSSKWVPTASNDCVISKKAKRFFRRKSRKINQRG